MEGSYKVYGYELCNESLKLNHYLKTIEEEHKKKKQKVRPLTLCELDKLMEVKNLN